jgi:hypothetical protein
MRMQRLYRGLLHIDLYIICTVYYTKGQQSAALYMYIYISVKLIRATQTAASAE